MSYFHGLGVIPQGPAGSVPWWCSPEMPQGGCAPTAGLCKPMNAGTLTLFQMIQRRINAISAKRRLPLVDVDGRIGSKTVLALRAISSDPFSIVDCNAIAKNSLALVGALEAQMNSEGASYVPDPGGSRPSTVKPDGTVEHPPAGFSPMTLMLLAVGIGAVIALGTKKGRRK